MRPLRAAVCAALALSLLSGCSRDGGVSAPASPSPAASAGIEGLRTYTNMAGGYTTSPVDYAQSPPVGGRSHPLWATCDGVVYDKPLPDERAVHSLANGAAWITYKPGLPDYQVGILSSLVRGTDYRFMSPYPGQKSPITLTAWGAQLDVDSATDPRVALFLTLYTQGRGAPQRGVSCAKAPASLLGVKQ